MELSETQKAKIAEMNEPRVVEASEHDGLMSDRDELQEKVDEQETRIDELSGLSDNFDKLSERTELLDEVGRDAVENLAEYEDPVLMEQDEYDELESQVDSIRTIYANKLSDVISAFTSDELENMLTLEEMQSKMEENFGEDYEEELAGGEPEGQDLTDEELEALEDEEYDEESNLSAEEQDEVKAEQERIANGIFG